MVMAQLWANKQGDRPDSVDDRATPGTFYGVGQPGMEMSDRASDEQAGSFPPEREKSSGRQG
jgi:hypothetical protein